MLWRRRNVLAVLAAGAGICATRRAAAGELPAELAQPAALSPAASFSLYNNIAAAGARLVAVGERGHILLSDDSGRSWRQVPVPVSATLVAARFATPKCGWAVGQMGVILKTTDGGETWRLVLNGFQAANLMLEEAKPLSDNAPQMQNAQSLIAFGASVPLLVVLPLSESQILAFGAYGLALESFDAGETWHGIGARLQNPQGYHLYGGLLSSQTLVAVGEAGLLLHGPQTGTLAAAASPYQGSLFGAVTPTPTSVLAYGLQGTLLRSTDAGATWQSQTPASTNGILCGIVLRDGRVALGDESGNLLLSHDAGVTFRATPGTLPVTALAQAADGALIAGSPMGLRRIEV